MTVFRVTSLSAQVGRLIAIVGVLLATNEWAQTGKYYKTFTRIYIIFIIII